MNRLFKPCQTAYVAFYSGLMCWKIWILVPILAALTFILATGGLDAVVNKFAQKQYQTISLIWSAPPMLLGLVVPVLVPLYIAKRHSSSNGAVLFGTVLSVLFWVSILKLMTSRANPEMQGDVLALSQLFRFGFFEAGIVESVFEGWPSGHAATNTALSYGIYRLSSDFRIRYFACVWAIWVVLATTFGINGDVHWLSDSLTGAVLGWIISNHVIVNQ